MTPVADLVLHPGAAAALSCLEAETDRTLSDAITICEIPAPSFHELERARWVAEQFAALGLADVTTDDLGNVYGRRPGAASRPAVMLAAHTDTVFPAGTPIQVRRVDGRLYGPGIVDNSIAVASLLALTRALDAARVRTRGDVWLVATVGEEGLGNLRGIRAAVDRLGDQVAAVIAVEGQGLGKIYNRSIGSRRYRITVKAPGGHSWGAFGNRSAIHELFRLGAGIAALDVPSDPKVTYNIGVIGGGTSVNSIAEEAYCLLDMRSGDPSALDDLERRVMDLVAATDAVEDVTVTTTLIGDRPAGAIDDTSPLLQACFDALAHVGAEAAGHPTRLTEGSTDANIPMSRGIPSTCIALTTGGGTHTVSEYLDPGPVRLGLQQLLLVTLAVVGVQ